jgi:hypothetical protein
MNVDTGQFAALREQVAEHEVKLASYGRMLRTAFEVAGMPVPGEAQPPRHGRPQDRHLRFIRGGQR